jgi:hypothetical protein
MMGNLKRFLIYMETFEEYGGFEKVRLIIFSIISTNPFLQYCLRFISVQSKSPQ